MVVCDALDRGDATLDDQSAIRGDFIASACQKFSRRNSIMAEEAVNAVSVFVTRTVMVKREGAPAVASEKE
jgi:hypothetical protein